MGVSRAATRSGFLRPKFISLTHSANGATATATKAYHRIRHRTRRA